MEYKGYNHIKFERNEKGILRVKFNRPDDMNAVNASLHEELSRVFSDIARDAGARVVILSGEGKAFSAGGDIQWLNELKTMPYKVIREGVEIVRRLLELPQPIIAQLNGHAIGLGATIALYCDLIIASEKAKIGDPHVQVGLVAGDGGAGIWPMVLGPAKAKQYLLTGDPLTAEDAMKLGLINEVVPPEQLEERTEYWAERLLNGSQLAIQLTKRAVNRHLKRLVDDIVEPSLFFEGLTFFSNDLKEGVQSFLEKRTPRFNENVFG